MATASLRQATKRANVEKVKTVDTPPGTDVVIESETTVASAVEVQKAPEQVAQTQAAEKFDEKLFDKEGQEGPVAATPTPVPAPATTVGQTSATPRSAVNTTTAVAVVSENNNEVGPSNRYLDVSGGSIQGDFDTTDIKFPQLKVVQGSSYLKELFAEGTIVFCEEELLPPPPLPKPNQPLPILPTIRFAPVIIKKGYRENLSDADVKGGLIARMASSLSEVEAVGGTALWEGKQKPSWAPCAQCLFVLERPENSEHSAFPNEFGGKFYAAAGYFAGGGAYRHSAQLILNTALTSLLLPLLDLDGKPVLNNKKQVIKKVCLFKNWWTFKCIRTKSGDFNVLQPRCLLTKEETSPEIREYCQSLLSTGEDRADGE